MIKLLNFVVNETQLYGKLHSSLCFGIPFDIGFEILCHVMKSYTEMFDESVWYVNPWRLSDAYMHQ